MEQLTESGSGAELAQGCLGLSHPHTQAVTVTGGPCYHGPHARTQSPVQGTLSLCSCCIMASIHPSPSPGLLQQAAAGGCTPPTLANPASLRTILCTETSHPLQVMSPPCWAPPPSAHRLSVRGGPDCVLHLPFAPHPLPACLLSVRLQPLGCLSSASGFTHTGQAHQDMAYLCMASYHSGLSSKATSRKGFQDNFLRYDP